MIVSNSIINTLEIHSKLLLTKIPTYWKIKIFTMHAIVITAYLSPTLWDCFTKEALALWFMLIYLFVPGRANTIYFSRIILSILGLVYVTAQKKHTIPPLNLPQLVIGYAGGTLIVLETENDNFHYKEK